VALLIFGSNNTNATTRASFGGGWSARTFWPFRTSSPVTIDEGVVQRRLICFDCASFDGYAFFVLPFFFDKAFFG
jgi:hypothetical protein